MKVTGTRTINLHYLTHEDGHYTVGFTVGYVPSEHELRKLTVFINEIIRKLKILDIKHITINHIKTSTKFNGQESNGIIIDEMKGGD